ncbi:hypothetical protein [Sulfurivirga sp.]|uniref:hypothetical protein n=1 Tax=Sulfurivirga sp. TaxID=2614236 RepID=UPI0025F4E82A|nr:hypothetical protein [Sulfurivirga sp.]
MPESLELTHREAAILLDEVFAPFMELWQSDARLQPLIEDRRTYRHFLAEMAHVLGALLHGRSDALVHLKALCLEAQAVGLPQEAVEDYAARFIDTFERWVAQADAALLDDGRETVQARIAQLRAQQMHCGDAPEEAEGFVMADSGHMDAVIDSMHNITAGREAVSAWDFIASGVLDEDTVERIVEDVEDLTGELYFYGGFDRDYARFVASHLEEFSRALDATMEFDDLAWAVRQFIHVLEHLPEELDAELGVSVKKLTDQFVEDLAGWVSHVLVEQDAQDIHYLDAAMMASVKQIAMLLGVPLERTDKDEAVVVQQGGDDDFVMF